MVLLALLSASHRVRLVTFINSAAIVLAVLLAEVILQTNPNIIYDRQIQQVGHHLPTKPQWPHVCPNNLPAQGLIRPDGGPIMPLSGIAENSMHFLNTATGEHYQRYSDAFGFNNPPGLWNGGAVELVTIGDSYTYGADVAPDEGFADRLRQWYRVVNLGCGGNGPLVEFATLREYGHRLKPKTVVWAYYEGNDLTKNLDKELQNQVLIRYMRDANFTQGLAQRQSQIDAVLKSHIFWL